MKQNMKAVFIAMQLQMCPGVLNLDIISVLLLPNKNVNNKHLKLCVDLGRSFGGGL